MRYYSLSLFVTNHQNQKNKMIEQRKIKLWKPPYPLVGHLFIYGAVGSGKTQKLTALIQWFQQHRYKIFDIFGGRRHEGPFWCLPNDDIRLWKDLEKETYAFKTEGPKKYRVNLLYPLFSKTMPKRLPITEDGRVKSKVFTIPIKDLDLIDVKCVLGETASGNKTVYVFERIINNIKNNNCGPEIDFIFKTKMPKLRSLSVYRNFFKPLIDNRILTNKHNDLNLDIIEEAKDKEVITVLCMEHVPERFKFFVMRYFIKKIRQSLLSDKIPKKNIAFFREASEFMKLQDSADLKGSQMQVFRNEIVNTARYSRDGLHLAVDTQSPNEVKGMIDGQEDLLCICELPGKSDIEYITQALKNRISRQQTKALPMLKIQQICIVARGERAKILNRIAPPRTRYWKQGKDNFYTTWKKEVDTWKSADYYLDKIEELYNQEKLNIVIKYNKLKEQEDNNKLKEGSKDNKKEKYSDITDEEKELEMLKEELKKYPMVKNEAKV